MKEQSKKVNRAKGGKETRKTTINQLKEENRQLRQEIARLQGSHPAVLTNELANVNLQLNGKIAELEAIRNILSVVTTQPDLQAILNLALEAAIELTGMEGGTLCLVDHNQQILTLSAARNTSQEMVRDLSNGVKLGNCFCGDAARTGEPFILWGNASDSEFATLKAVHNEGIHFHAAFPMMIKRKSVGFLCIFSRSQTKPTQESLDLVRDLCNPIALAIENALLCEEARREAARYSAVAHTAAQTNVRLDLETVLNTVCEEAACALDVPAANIFLYDEQHDELIVTADFGFPTGFRQSHPPLPRVVFEKLIVGLGSSNIVEDMQAIPGLPNTELYAEQGIRSIMFVSTFYNQSLVGLFNVFSRGGVHHFTKDDLTLLQVLADQATQAIVNTRLYEQVSAGRKHLLTLTQQLVEVQEAERRTLALELHDELGQLLSSVKMSLGMVAILPEKEAHHQLQRAQKLVGVLVSRVRRMSLELRPSLLDNMGLLPTLEWLFENYQNQTGKAVEFKCSTLGQRFPPMVEITAYRIIQESLTNVIRHAENKQVYVNIWTDEHNLNLQIMDRGGGFDLGTVLAQGKSSGLSGMRERARLLGGDLVIETEPNAGTCLTGRLPLDSNAQSD